MTMYSDTDLDRILDQFLGEGPAAAPDRAIDTALDRIADVRQRRSSTITRRFQMPVLVRIVLAAALLLAALAIGGLYFGSQPPTPVPSMSPSPTAPPALTTAQRDWCVLHLGGPGEDQHQVEDMALELGLIGGATTREEVFGRWAGSSPMQPTDPTYRIACIAAYERYASASPAAVSTVRPSTAPTPATASPVAALGMLAVNRVDAAIEAARGAGAIVTDDQSRLFRFTDGVRLPLQESGNVSQAIAAFAELEPVARETAATLEGPTRDRLITAIDTLGGVLQAVPVPSGDIPAGTYHSTAFSPTMAVAVPEGWTRGIEDPQLLVLRKDGVQVAFQTMAPEVSEIGLAKALGTSDPTSLDVPPAAVELPSYSGFFGGLDGGGGRTLWYTDSLQAFDAAPGDAIRTWVLQAGARPLTVDLVGPPDAVAAAQADVEAMLSSLVVR